MRISNVRSIKMFCSVFVFLIFLPSVALSLDSANDADSALLFMEHKANVALMGSGGVKITDIDFNITSEITGTNSLDLEVDLIFTVDNQLYTGTGVWSSNELIQGGETLSNIDLNIELTSGTKVLSLEYHCNGNLATGNQVESISYSHDGTVFHDDITNSVVFTDDVNPIKTTTTEHLVTKNGVDRTETIIIEEIIYPTYSKITSNLEIHENGDTTVIAIKSERHNTSETEVRISFSQYDVIKNGIKTHRLTNGITEARLSLSDLVSVQMSQPTGDQPNTTDPSTLSIDSLPELSDPSTTLVENTELTVLSPSTFNANSGNDKRLSYTIAISLRSLVPEESDIKHAVTTSIDLSNNSALPAPMTTRSGSEWFDLGDPNLTNAMIAGIIGGGVAGVTAALNNPAAWANLPLSMSIGALTGAAVYTWDAYVKYKKKTAYENMLKNRVREMSRPQTHSGSGASLSDFKKLFLALTVLLITILHLNRKKRLLTTSMLPS